MSGIFNALAINDLIKKVNLLHKYIMTIHQPAIVEMAGAMEEDDKRINDLQDKIRNLEKEIAELKRTNKQK